MGFTFMMGTFTKAIFRRARAFLPGFSLYPRARLIFRDARAWSAWLGSSQRLRPGLVLGFLQLLVLDDQITDSGATPASARQACTRTASPGSSSTSRIGVAAIDRDLTPG